MRAVELKQFSHYTQWPYLLKFIVCLFVCAELIEELARATDFEPGIRMEHVVATNKY